MYVFTYLYECVDTYIYIYTYKYIVCIYIYTYSTSSLFPTPMPPPLAPPAGDLGPNGVIGPHSSPWWFRGLMGSRRHAPNRATIESAFQSSIAGPWDTK